MSKNKDVDILGFDEYLRQGEPGKKEKAEIWRIAIGLQDVDGLKTSEYLRETARKNIEGEISIDQARSLISSYYSAKENRNADSGQVEADKASANIAKILKEKTFAFSLPGLAGIHRRIFDGVFKFAGRIRDYNITKKEWVLEGDTVLYVPAVDIKHSVEYDIQQEKQFDYSNLDIDGVISHLVKFVSGLWQIHPFGEGNTRTTAVFTIKYLKSLGFDVNNDMFANHSWYFRNALVRANYRSVPKGINYEPKYLERFFQNLLDGKNWDLKNRYLHIRPTKEWSNQPLLSECNGAGQVQDKYRTSTSPNLKRLASAIGKEHKSIREIMGNLGLKGRDSFLKLYLKPSLALGLTAMEFPDSPRHPKQRYYLTAKGLTLLKQ